MNKNDHNELFVPLGSVLKTTSGGTPSRKVPAYYKGSIPWVKSGELLNNVIYDTDEKITEEAINNSSAKLFPPGTLLLALYGATIGKLAFLGVKAATNQAICGIFENKYIDSHYIFYYLLSIKPKLIAQGSGGAQPNISQDIVRKQKFPVIPLPEQRAIVAKIEQLFSDLDNGIANLKQAREQLKVYRQAVLKKAFEGELTKEWREKQTDLPSAEELLQQIKAERGKHYAEQLESWKQSVSDWEAKGKPGKKPVKPKKPKELPPLTKQELAELPQLPNGWQWEKLGNSVKKLSDGPFGSNLKTSDYVNHGVRVIRLENIGNLNFDNSKLSYVTEEKYETIKSHSVYPGDIIFSTFIAEETKVSIIPNEISVAINKADCLCIRPINIVDNKYLEYYLSTHYTYNQLVINVHGATRPRVNTTQLKSLVTPLCSPAEQEQIVSEIESRLSVCDNVEANIEASLQQSEALRQSILKKAFEGKLLSESELAICRTEPDYEPAEKLLKRIKSEKEGK